MIRKAIIVLLTLGAVGMGLLYIRSYRWHDATVSPLKGDFCFMAAGPDVCLYTRSLTGWLWLGRLNGPLCETLNTMEGVHTSMFVRGLLSSTGGPEQASLFGSVSSHMRGLIVSFHRPVGSEAAGLSWVAVPHWLLVVLFIFLPTLAFIRGPLRRWRRRRKGLCVRTGNVSGVCPECGTKIKKS